jgi:hypothetical protein
VLVSTTIASSEALQTYSRKPDCFRKAAGSISTQCANLDMDEEARVNGNNGIKGCSHLFQKIWSPSFFLEAAISMTLCEIATAKHYSLPLECRSFSLDNNMQDRVHKSHQTQGDCVEWVLWFEHIPCAACCLSGLLALKIAPLRHSL